MKQLIQLSLLCLSLIMLTACDAIKRSPAFQSQDQRYLAARSIPPLRIPPGISSSAFQNQYPVSHRAYPASAKKVSIIPPGLDG